MKKVVLLLLLLSISVSFLNAQTTTPIDAKNMAVFTVPSEGDRGRFTVAVLQRSGR